MPADDPPTLADDEATLQRYGAELADAFEAVARDWFARLISAHAAGILDGVSAELDRAAAAAADAFRSLLEEDIAEQAIGPLEVLRRAVAGPTEVLRRAGVEPVRRDEFAERNFPDDVYDLTPASFSDVDPLLHEPGLMWGAAKAHVHLRRRREAKLGGLP